MTQKIKRVGTKVHLRGGSKSYLHFINYMPIDGEIVKVDLDHFQGQHPRPYLVKFSDGRESWYAGNELTVS